MSVYKFFPEKDTFISSQYNNENYSRDEILDISCDKYSINRSLIYFNNDDLINFINNNNINIISSSFNLKLYLAYSSNIPINYSIYAYPLTKIWDAGTGRSGDEPNPKNGVCWDYNSLISSSIWSGGEYNDLIYSSQSFNYNDNKDINIDIKNIINSWYDNSLTNNGIILKYNNIIESSSILISNQFFSMDTHTIYPPCLEIQWDDSIQSSSLNIINNEFKSSIVNLKNEYNQDSIYKFKIKSRDLYPVRQFQTSSLYLNNKILPENSYWSLIDSKTKEIVIDYGIGTKLSNDDEGNYFKIYMNGLQKNRYYNILIKTELDNGNIIIIDNNDYFRIK
jgi:hypothetical protein